MCLIQQFLDKVNQLTNEADDRKQDELVEVLVLLFVFLVFLLFLTHCFHLLSVPYIDIIVTLSYIVNTFL